MDENKTYTTLSDKYFAGETTQNEELQLLDLLKARAQGEMTPQERVTLLMLSSAAEARGSRTESAEVAVVSTPRRSSHKSWWLSISAVAAAVALILAIRSGMGSDSPLGYHSGEAIASEYEAFTLAEECLAEVYYNPDVETQW